MRKERSRWSGGWKINRNLCSCSFTLAETGIKSFLWCTCKPHKSRNYTAECRYDKTLVIENFSFAYMCEMMTNLRRLKQVVVNLSSTVIDPFSICLRTWHAVTFLFDITKWQVWRKNTKKSCWLMDFSWRIFPYLKLEL